MSIDHRLIIISALLWAGMIAGISFLEAPVKFQAPSLTLSAGVDVGRHVFAAFEQCQWCLSLALVLAMPVIKPPTSSKVILVVILLLMIIQSVWLLPELNQKAADIIAHKPVSSSAHHWFFAIIELIKFILLISLACSSFHYLTPGE